MLHPLTNTVNFLALIMALWLGLYLVTRNPHRAETWLAGLALWSIGGYFLNELLAINPPAAPPAQMRDWIYHLLLFWPRDVFEQGWRGWQQGWLSTYGIVFWYHATLLMLPGAFNRTRAGAALGGYAAAFAGILIKARFPEAWINPAGDPLYITSPGGPLVLLYAAGLVVFCGLSVANLRQTARLSPRTMPGAQPWLFVAATLSGAAAALAGAVYVLAGQPVPQVLPAFLLMLALLLAGIGVARYNAILSRKPLQRDFLYSAGETGAVLVVYLLFLWLYHRYNPLPAITFVIVGCLAVITHHLIDLARLQLDRIFLRNRSRQLRLRLRGLWRPAGNTPPGEVIQTALAMTSREVSAEWSLMLEFCPQGVQQVAGENVPSFVEMTLDSYPESSLHAGNVVILNRSQLPPPLDQAVLLVPLYQAEQTGVLLLGPSRSQAGYSDAEIEVLREVGDTLAALLRDLRLSGGAPLRTPHDAIQPVKVLPENDGVISFHTIEHALRNLDNFACLADSPLTSLRLVQQRVTGIPGQPNTYLDCGVEVSSILREAVGRLRPGEQEPANTPPRSWFPYLILRDAYLEGEPNREIMSRLFISEGTFNRTRRTAIYAVARLIQEMESAAIQKPAK